MATRKSTNLSPAHKAAMATGRSESAAVKRYLDALEQNRPKRGRKRTPDSIKKRIQQVDKELESAESVSRLNLIQERKDLEAELGAIDRKVDMGDLESGFIGVAASYAERKGISYATWREVGVPAEVLRKAGISRGSS
jgi:hypothetical protein